MLKQELQMGVYVLDRVDTAFEVLDDLSPRPWLGFDVAEHFVSHACRSSTAANILPELGVVCPGAPLNEADREIDHFLCHLQRMPFIGVICDGKDAGDTQGVLSRPGE